MKALKQSLLVFKGATPRGGGRRWILWMFPRVQHMCSNGLMACKITDTRGLISHGIQWQENKEGRPGRQTLCGGSRRSCDTAHPCPDKVFHAIPLCFDHHTTK